MKKLHLLSLAAALAVATMVLIACGKSDSGGDQTDNGTGNDPLTYDAGVVINGVKWATRNVDAPGTFTPTPQDPGMLYQWNRIKGWSLPPIANVIDPNWNDTEAPGNTWESANDPCPAGWRVPTLDELRAFVDIVNNIEPPTFTVTPAGDFIFGSGDNVVFFPGSRGSLNYSDGSLVLVGRSSDYWSSTPMSPDTNVDQSKAYFLELGNDGYGSNYSMRSDGFFVRCIAK